MIEFIKYQGTGNDFIIIDNRQHTFKGSQPLIAQLCHRRFGVGADGLILLEDAYGYDFRMKYYNADGLEGSMCGNGGRCAVQFAIDLGICGSETRFIATDGDHLAKQVGENISLKMKDVNEVLDLNEGYFVNTGSPHLVIFSFGLENIDVKTNGAKIRYNDHWSKKGGVNVNYVEILDGSNLKIRTYERGVENETYSCGTGATAAAIVSHLRKYTTNKLSIQTLGGLLNVTFNHTNSHITEVFLSGPAKKVFSGQL